jgi:hypothetical protein
VARVATDIGCCPAKIGQLLDEIQHGRGRRDLHAWIMELLNSTRHDQKRVCLMSGFLTFGGDGALDQDDAVS